MKNLITIIIKEFKQIFRDRGMLPIIILLPIIQLFILAHAATFDIKNLKIYFIDKDNSSITREIRSKFIASGYFIESGFGTDNNLANESIDLGLSDLSIEFSDGFTKSLYDAEKSPNAMININAIDGTKAGMALFYANSIINDVNQKLLNEQAIKNGIEVKDAFISSETSFWYNPELNYKTFMVPGILALLITMISTFLAAMNIVKEKEIGTIEQINVTPIKKYQFLMGKMIPLWLLAIFELAFGLIVSKIMYDIPMLGEFYVLFGFAGIYLIACVGLGLLISTVTDTQQQAMFVTWFMMMIFILLSGLFTSVQSMPEWVRVLNIINPVQYMITVIRLVMLKGSSFTDILPNLIPVVLIAIFVNGVAILNYKKAT